MHAPVAPEMAPSVCFRGETCTHAARYDGHELASVLDATNSSKSIVWVGSSCSLIGDR